MKKFHLCPLEWRWTHCNLEVPWAMWCVYAMSLDNSGSFFILLSSTVDPVACLQLFPSSKRVSDPRWSFILPYWQIRGYPRGSGGKESACQAGNSSSILRLGWSPGEGNGNPLPYSYLETSMDRGAWRATVHGVTKSQTRLKRLSTQHLYFILSLVLYHTLVSI